MSLLGAIADHYVATPAFVPFGGVAASGSTENTANRYLSWDSDPATTSGTVTQVQANLASSGNVAFFTISSADVVRAVSTTVAGTAGTANYVVSLAVEPGDRIGIWVQLGGKIRHYSDTGGFHFAFSSVTAKPSPSDSLAGLSSTQSGRRLALRASAGT